MNERLRKLMQQVIVKEGVPGKIRLAAVAGRGQRMIERYASGLSVPSTDIAYRLAIACGANATEALALAGEGSDGAKETA